MSVTSKRVYVLVITAVVVVGLLILTSKLKKIVPDPNFDSNFGIQLVINSTRCISVIFGLVGLGSLVVIKE